MKQNGWFSRINIYFKSKLFYFGEIFLTVFKIRNSSLLLTQWIHQGLLHFNIRCVNYSSFSKLFYKNETKIRTSHDSDKIAFFLMSTAEFFLALLFQNIKWKVVFLRVIAVKIHIAGLNNEYTLPVTMWSHSSVVYMVIKNRKKELTAFVISPVILCPINRNPHHQKSPQICPQLSTYWIHLVAPCVTSTLSGQQEEQNQKQPLLKSHIFPYRQW